MAQKKKRFSQEEEEENFENFTPNLRILSKVKIDLKCKNERQKLFIKLINSKDIVICAGPAGTGKTFVACAEALKLLTSQGCTYKKIIIAKSVTVLEGEEIGFLKGTLQDKMEPFMISFMDNFHKLIGKELSNTLLANDMI